MSAKFTSEQIETVLFDLDQTLLRYQRSPEELLAASFENCGLDPLFSAQAYYDRFEEFRREYDSINELRAACFETLAREQGHDPALGREVAAAYAEMRDQTNVELLPGARTVLERLHGRVQLGIVTNGTGDTQRTKIEAVDLNRHVETVVFAGEDVPAKPEPEPFELALSRLDSDPSRTVHVGDSLESDVRGADAAGIHPVWVATDESDLDHPATHRIRSLPELPTLFEELS